MRALATADSLSYGLGKKAKAQSVRGYVPMANLYMGIALQELGDRAAAGARFRRVLELPDHEGTRDLARRYLRLQKRKAAASSPGS